MIPLLLIFTSTPVLMSRQAPQMDGWMFESQQRQTLFVKTGRDSSTAKRSATGVSVTSPLRLSL